MQLWPVGAWSLRLYYFWYFAAAGIYFPYVSLYYHEIHLDGAQIGLLASLAPLAGVLLPPLWGLLSDRLGWRKRILITSVLTAAIVAPLVPLLGSFTLLLAIIVLLAVVLSPAVPLADATTLEWLRGNGGTFGNIRVFGSIGYLGSSLLVGILFSGRHILWLFPLYGAVLFGACLATLIVPGQHDRAHLSSGEGIRSILRDRRVTIFLALVILGYTSFAAYNTFFALYLKELGAGTSAVGLATGIATLCELPGMVVAGMVIRKFGVKPVLLAGMGSLLIRWIGYALIHDYRLALLFQPLHALGFASFYVAGVTFIDTLVPGRLRSTGQTLFTVAFFGAGAVIGSNLFGFLFDRIHGSGMFYVAAAIVTPALLGLIVFVPNIRADEPAQ
ncbi:MAG: putative 3-phenylpropionic acid transporter [Chloroflexi bacterium]|nr:putative 3-phenylpropionic acid transporter [Chloroflexota bacterium]